MQVLNGSTQTVIHPSIVVGTGFSDAINRINFMNVLGKNSRPHARMMEIFSAHVSRSVSRQAARIAGLVSTVKYANGETRITDTIIAWLSHDGRKSLHINKATTSSICPTNTQSIRRV